MYLHRHLYILLRDQQLVGRYHDKNAAMKAYHEEMEKYESITLLTNCAFETYVKGKRRIIQVVQCL